MLSSHNTPNITVGARNRGNALQKDMRKIQKLTEIQPSLAFSEYDVFRQYEQSFYKSELGGLYRCLPLGAMADAFGLKDSRLGRKSYFSSQGKLALMILKSYTSLSDRDLIDQLNANLHYQLFCGVRINPLTPLDNFKIVSEIRCELASKLDIGSLQQVLASYWKPYLKDSHVLMSDATCYESNMRFPTDVKLLWESVSWLHGQLKGFVKVLKLRMPRNKYDKHRKRYGIYSKKRKRRVVETRVLKRSLLHLLDKLLGQLQTLITQHKANLDLPLRFHKRLSIIKKVWVQQQDRFLGKEVKGLIVSIDKDYIRPIVRGKESKRVEFGAKVNSIQVDGINFIEHLSFEAFHEGIRLPQSIDLQQSLLRKRVSHVAADALYATNANRSYCQSRGIFTSFVRKGKPASDEKDRSQLRSVLNKERSTRLEGSFGTEKQHYALNRIKARTKKTEVLWIFFGIHTANAVRMIAKMQDQQRQAA